MSDSLNTSIKYCPKCKQNLNINDFWNNRAMRDGKDSYCKVCRKAHTIKCPVEPPPFRICKGCGKEKPIAKFKNSKSRRDGKEMYCTNCRAACSDKSSPKYKRAKAKTRIRNRRVRVEQKTKLIEMMGGKCVDCNKTPGEEWPLDCFDFHHLDSDKKEGIFSKKLAQTTAWDWLVNESKYCVVLDATCHRRRHAKQNEALRIAALRSV